MNRFYEAVVERARNRCEYCRAPGIVFNFPFEVEHILPQAHGGTNESQNLALSCHACNLFKSDFETGRDPSGTPTLLLHPRRDVWSEHFRADTVTAMIEGITPMGQATISRLQMNRPQQVQARRRWIILDLFP